MNEDSSQKPATNPESRWNFQNIESCPYYARMCAWIERDCAVWGDRGPSRLDMELSEGRMVDEERVCALEAESGLDIGACAGTDMKVNALLLAWVMEKVQQKEGQSFEEQLDERERDMARFECDSAE